MRLLYLAQDDLHMTSNINEEAMDRPHLNVFILLFDFLNNLRQFIK